MLGRFLESLAAGAHVPIARGFAKLGFYVV
jgi:hypothetical protein